MKRRVPYSGIADLYGTTEFFGGDDSLRASGVADTVPEADAT